MLEAILFTIITAATPLLFAAVGELVAERSGVLNLGVEGMMAVGAVCGFAAANLTGMPVAGILAAALAGAAMATRSGLRRCLLANLSMRLGIVAEKSTVWRD